MVAGMERAIVGALLAAQELAEHRDNSFALYGADFMLCEDFTPWLLEINSQPCLASTTSVTSRLCPEVVEDLCKGDPSAAPQTPSIMYFSNGISSKGLYDMTNKLFLLLGKSHRPSK